MIINNSIHLANDGSKAICILGMHRSGTSTVSRLLNLLGVYLGELEDIGFAAPENPEGFWEMYDIVCMHESILANLGMSWDTILPIHENFFVSQQSAHCIDQIKTLIANKFSGRPLWGWKDPRTCLFLPLWMQALRELNTELKCVFVVRNPLDVANSLLARNNITKDKALWIWFSYNLAALRAVRSIPTVFISYDELLENWPANLKKCSDGLGIDWPEEDKDFFSEVSTFIKPELCHSRSTIDHLREMPRPIVKLFNLLISCVSGKYTEEVEREIEVSFLNLSDFASLLDVERLRFQDLLQLFEECSMRCDILEAQAGRSERELDGLKEQLEQIQLSFCWRITSPLRRILDAFK